VPQAEEQFADRLVKLMDDQCWSVRDLARLTGFSTSTIQNWRSGKTKPRPGDARRRLVSIFRVRPGYLFRGEEDD
jgi:transcriptional regulator with XRE-family HTH domain